MVPKRYLFLLFFVYPLFLPLSYLCRLNDVKGGEVRLCSVTRRGFGVVNAACALLPSLCLPLHPIQATGVTRILAGEGRENITLWLVCVS